jgi:hypothetical protein
MPIRVITQTTAERNQETRELFQQVKPYLDKGYGLWSAVREIKGTPPSNPYGGWYKDLKNYAIAQGYDYIGNKGHRGKRMINVIERTNQDIDNETRELFLACKPYLDEGKGFYESCRIVRNIPKTSCFGNRSWYKRFRAYAISQGYKPLR